MIIASVGKSAVRRVAGLPGGCVLRRVIDVAGLAMRAVLRVDLHARVSAVGIVLDLVDACRGAARLGCAVKREVGLDRNLGVFHR
jgi:hypothetical protein